MAEAPDDLPRLPAKSKGKPITRTPKQQAAIEKAEADRNLADQRTEAKARAAQLAQVVNLLLAGHSYEDIGSSIGASADEVERMVTTGADRYVRTQPALRSWVRKWLSAKYTEMIAANIDVATDPNHPDRLENQDRVIKMLTPMARLHGADAPTQSEVEVHHNADDVEALVQRLASSQGQGYDVSVFDGDDDDVHDIEVVVHDAASSSLAALEAASQEVERPQEGDEGDLHT